MLGQFIGAGVLLTLLANEYGPGEGIPMEEVLDPNDPNFMRFRIDGQDASIFGPWDSLVKGVMKTAQGDYGYFARTKASPAVSLAWNALTGQTFTGDDFSPSSPGTMLRETVAPFSLSDSVLLGGDKSLEQTAIGMTGTKTTPMTPSEELGQISRAKFGKDYRDLSASQKKTIKDEHPEVWERVVERSDKLLVQSEEVKNRYIAEQKARNDDLLSGRLTLEEWREAKDDAAARKDGEMAQIYKDKDFDSRDKIMDAYYTMLDSATVNGVFDHAARESYLASLSESDRKHIEDNTGLYATPLEKLDRRLRTEYYDLPQHRGFTADESRDIDELWTMVRNNARGTEIPFMLRSLRLADTSGYSEKVIRGVRRRILGYLRLAKDRERYRKKNPAADALLSQGALTADMAAAIEAEID